MAAWPLRSSEWLLLTYFSYIAALAVATGLNGARFAVVVALPLAVALLPLGSLRLPKANSVARDWVVLALFLMAYREVDWVHLPRPRDQYVRQWIAWDRLLLNDWGARAAIEHFGRILPSILEISYALMYAIPPLSIATLYVYRRRDRVDKFLFTLLLGALLTYAILPYFPCESPRVIFPGADLPHLVTLPRQFNIWVLDNFDIHTGVFPSGHVTAAFSASFAMFLAFPEKKWPAGLLLIMAGNIAITTVYGRYHYAVDGVAGLAVSLFAAGISEVTGNWRSWRSGAHKRPPVVEPENATTHTRAHRSRARLCGAWLFSAVQVN